MEEFILFGNNYSGQLGNGKDQEIKNPEPFLIPNLENIKYLSCGAYHNLVLREDGGVYAFGDNEYGQLGIGQKFKIISEPQIIFNIENIAQVSAGYSHSLLLAEKGIVYSFGKYYSGSLGYDATDHQFYPQLIGGLENIKKITSGLGDHCFVFT